MVQIETSRISQVTHLARCKSCAEFTQLLGSTVTWRKRFGPSVPSTILDCISAFQLVSLPNLLK